MYPIWFLNAKPRIKMKISFKKGFLLKYYCLWLKSRMLQRIHYVIIVKFSGYRGCFFGIFSNLRVGKYASKAKANVVMFCCWCLGSPASISVRDSVFRILFSTIDIPLLAAAVPKTMCYSGVAIVFLRRSSHDCSKYARFSFYGNHFYLFFKTSVQASLKPSSAIHVLSCDFRRQGDGGVDRDFRRIVKNIPAESKLELILKYGGDAAKRRALARKDYVEKVTLAVDEKVSESETRENGRQRNKRLLEGVPMYRIVCVMDGARRWG